MDLVLKTVAFIFTKENVFQLKEKFGFTKGILLELPGEDEWITDRIVTRVALNDESLNARLFDPMLLVMADLLWWYQLCSIQLIPNA